ncbi:MAG: serine/threonine protein kinase [Planctomycetota bacterium]|jgi:serine/threonine-protein kinase|nr:serine/threonine protein kinase [Planctomycetota bacterium]
MSTAVGGVIEGSYYYKVIRKIADGGMGSVYEVEQHGAEGFVKRMALKTIIPRYTNNKEFVDMFIGEAKLVGNLVHPNIVQIYQLGRTNEGFFIAMEFIEGINLENFLLRHFDLKRKIPLDIATFIISRVCRGLEYAHTKTDVLGRPLNIVHRDVSPKNILINTEGECKLTDFGIAKARNYMEQDEERVLMGKVEYMSPEQADYRITDARSDLFSLGIVYAELLTGNNGFVGADTNDTLERVKKAEPPRIERERSDIPPEIVKIVNKALQKSPMYRYQNATDMVYDLEYQMYSRGFGPTISALAKYTAELFPNHNFAASKFTPLNNNAGR